MKKKRKINQGMYTNMGVVDPRNIEQQITYPGQREFNLRNVTFAPDENNYLNALNDGEDTIEE